MQNHILLPILLALSISACTSATKQQINKPISTPNQIAVTMQQTEPGLKRVVAIGRFSDESKRSSSFLVDQNNNRLGKQASDILNARLNQSGKFILLERTDIAVVDAEKDASNSHAKIGADFIILGSVSEFGRETVSEVGIFSRNKIQKATATVNVRLVNVKTSEIIYSEEATAEATSEANQVFGVGESAAFNTALDDKAVSAAVSKLVANVMNNLLDMPWRSYLLSQQEGQFIIAGGLTQGIKPGSEFLVYQVGESVVNPQSGKTIELPGKAIGKIRVTSSVGKGNDEISYATLIEGTVDNNAFDKYQIREL